MISFMFLSFLVWPLQQTNAANLTDGTTQEFEALLIKDQRIRLLFRGKSKEFDVDQIERLTFVNRPASDAKSTVQVKLANGSKISTHSLEATANLIKLDMGSGSENDEAAVIDVPRSLVHSIRLDESVSAKDWKTALEIAIETDGLVIERDGELDILEGVVKSINAESVEFDFRGRVNEVKLSRLAGIRFFQTTRKFDSKLNATDIFGNVISASSVELDEAQVKLMFDEKSSLMIPTRFLSKIDFSVGRFVSLDAIQPSMAEWKPYFRSTIEDRSVAELLQSSLSNRKFWTANTSFGERLSLKSVAKISRSNPTGRIDFESGISLIGGTVLAFEIPDDAIQFTALCGVRPSKGQVGSVDLVLKVDGKVMFKKTISGSDDLPTPITFDLPDALDGVKRRLSIVVGYGSGRHVGDVLNLCNARFAK